MGTRTGLPALLELGVALVVPSFVLDEEGTSAVAGELLLAPWLGVLMILSDSSYQTCYEYRSGRGTYFDIRVPCLWGGYHHLCVLIPCESWFMTKVFHDPVLNFQLEIQAQSATKNMHNEAT